MKSLTPKEVVGILNDVSERPCVRFEELTRLDVKNPYCGECESCIAGKALLVVRREARRRVTKD